MGVDTIAKWVVIACLMALMVFCVAIIQTATVWLFADGVPAVQATFHGGVESGSLGGYSGGGGMWRFTFPELMGWFMYPLSPYVALGLVALSSAYPAFLVLLLAFRKFREMVA